MRTITEDQEAGNEELLSANEELLSGSEELRSLNEELEISKEELQSTVEELSVSNQELAFRIDQLSYSRSYSEAIIATIREPLLVLDHELKVKTANSAFYKSFLCEKGQTEGKFIYEIDNHQWDIPELKRMLERTLTEDSFFESFEVKTKSTMFGERVMILNLRRILSMESNEQLVLVVIEDVTDSRLWESSLKDSVDHLREILESSPQISSTALPDGTVNYYNTYFLNYVGVTLDEAVSSGWEPFVHPDDLQLAAESWAHSVTTGEEFYVELRFKRHDGDYRWHISRALPTWNSDGQIMSWVGSAAEIHDQKMFAEELEKQVRSRTFSLKQVNIDLEHANRNLQQFSFIASHDLQEPLRKIQVFSAMLADNFKGQIPPTASALVDKIGVSSTRVVSLIRDVLNFSSMDNESNAFRVSDLNPIMRDVLGDFSLLIEEKKARIQLGKLPDAEVIPMQMNQLFYNILSNALKFSKSDIPPEINITSRVLPSFEVAKYSNLDRNSSYMEILFEDNGIGFDQVHSEHIFEIFRKLHRHGLFSGTGIGLALCKKIVEIHQGEIFVESRVGEGALFHVILPFRHNDSGE
jgi:two-component system, chemotaxis family, CheB/CheR fusion protein